MNIFALAESKTKHRYEANFTPWKIDLLIKKLVSSVSLI